MNPDTVVVGIDPGLQGAIAVLLGGELIELHDMPLMGSDTAGKKVPDPLAVAKILRDLTVAKPALVVIELCNAMPRKNAKTGALVKMGASSMLNFGVGLGMVEGAARIQSMAVEKVRPQDWKRRAGLINAKKESARLRAIELWPEAPLHLKKHHGRAEALLIARYGHDLWPAA